MKSKFYYKDGMTSDHRDPSRILHCTGGPAIEYDYGTKYWFTDGKQHREGGPAVEWANGTKTWWINGKLHRENGPAVEFASGIRYWFINDKEYTEGEHSNLLEEVDNLPLALKLTDPREWVRKRK